MRYFRGLGYFDESKCPGDCEKEEGLWYPICSGGFVAEGKYCVSTLLEAQPATGVSIWTFVIIAVIAAILLYYLFRGEGAERVLGSPGKTDLIAKLVNEGPKYYV